MLPRLYERPCGRDLPLNRTSVQHAGEHASFPLESGGAEILHNGRRELRGKRLSDAEARKRRFVVSDVIEWPGHDSAHVYVAHDVVGIRNALREFVELRLRKPLPDKNEQRAQGAAHLRLAQPESLLQLRN